MTKPNANEETEIRALIDDWARAMRAKDATAVVSQYAADNVKFILAPPQPKVEFELVLCSMLLRLWWEIDSFRNAGDMSKTRFGHRASPRLLIRRKANRPNAWVGTADRDRRP